MTTPLPSRLRESARELRDSGTTQDSLDWREIRDRSVPRIAAELEQAADALEAGPWMPIETAPKDGTAVMLGNSGGAWIGRFMQFAQSGYRFDDPWRSLMLNHYHIPYEHRYKAPTHWMPLPAAPAAQVAQEGGGVSASAYLAKVEADPRRAAALQRARDRTPGVATDGGTDAN